MQTVHSPPLAVKIWGELACFTRPETKVERVTYPVITPSAARGILEAIFWKPEFSRRVEGSSAIFTSCLITWRGLSLMTFRTNAMGRLQ